MNKSISMMFLDFYSIKEFLGKKNLAIFIALLLIFSFTMDSPGPAIGMFMMFGMFYSGYPFAAAEKYPLDRLYSSLPLPQRNLIFGRYLFALTVNLATGLTAFGVCMLAGLLRRMPVNAFEMILVIGVCFFIFTLIEFFQFPFFFKMGYNKARLIFIFPVLVIVIFAALVMNVGAGISPEFLNGGFDQWLRANLTALLAVVLAVWLGAFFLSYRLSCRLYSRREF